MMSFYENIFNKIGVQYLPKVILYQLAFIKNIADTLCVNCQKIRISKSQTLLKPIFGTHFPLGQLLDLKI